jgi:hypothetical protein
VSLAEDGEIKASAPNQADQLFSISILYVDRGGLPIANALGILASKFAAYPSLRSSIHSTSARRALMSIGQCG